MHKENPNAEKIENVFKWLDEIKPMLTAARLSESRIYTKEYILRVSAEWHDDVFKVFEEFKLAFLKDLAAFKSIYKENKPSYWELLEYKVDKEEYPEWIELVRCRKLLKSSWSKKTNVLNRPRDKKAKAGVVQPAKGDHESPE